MKRKVLIIAILAILIIPLVGCQKEEDLRKDAVKFKEEYESLNKQQNDEGNLYRTITVDEENPIIYTDYETLSTMIDEKQNFIVYFGSKKNKYSRSAVPYLIQQAKNQGIDKIYYVDIEPDFDEDVKELSAEDIYYQAILKDLNEKELKNSTLAVFINGQLSGKTSGISSKQTDGDMELTKEMKDEMIAKFKQIYITYNSNRD